MTDDNARTGDVKKPGLLGRLFGGKREANLEPDAPALVPAAAPTPDEPRRGWWRRGRAARGWGW